MIEPSLGAEDASRAMAPRDGSPALMRWSWESWMVKQSEVFLVEQHQLYSDRQGRKTEMGITYLLT